MISCIIPQVKYENCKPKKQKSPFPINDLFSFEELLSAAFADSTSKGWAISLSDSFESSTSSFWTDEPLLDMIALMLPWLNRSRLQWRIGFK
mmetsp:Transcript_20815/g.35065  ORF Transcript_20815/g.35065 Transcript_20815/m.35065 type:complete len:92 (+) Transcript_20815:580-855(+)